MTGAVLLAARALGGLLAGLYLGFAVAVMPALRQVDDATFVAVMNHINTAIINPVFLIVFLGAPAAAAALLVRDRSSVTVVTVSLAVAALAITLAANVPLNDALADGGARAVFETPWVSWHLARTAAATASFVLLCSGSRSSSQPRPVRPI